MSAVLQRSARRHAGKVLIAGLEGTSLSSMDVAWLKLIRPGGVILFRRNIESASQTYLLLKAARQAVDSPQFRCIDLEGGTVDRLRDLIAPMPSAAAVGATREVALFREHGCLIGRELRMLGLNTVLAPVLDLRTAASQPVMTTRVVSETPADVTLYAKHFLRGLAAEGVLGCGKHFPGLGSGNVDSHHSTPRIHRSFKELWEDDLIPYRQLAQRLPMVMISHAAYPETRSGPLPASVSSFWITDILERRIGFKGLILSDDMEMGGILSHTDMADAAVRAVLAGAHLIEICRDPALILTAFEALLTEAERSPAFARKLEGAAMAVENFQRRCLKRDLLPKTPTERMVLAAGRSVQKFSKAIQDRGGA